LLRRDFLALTLGTLGAVGCAVIKEAGKETDKEAGVNTQNGSQNDRLAKTRNDSRNASQNASLAKTRNDSRNASQNDRLANTRANSQNGRFANAQSASQNNRLANTQTPLSADTNASLYSTRSPSSEDNISQTSASKQEERLIAHSEAEKARLAALEDEKMAEDIIEDGIGSQGATPKDHLAVTGQAQGLKPIVAEGTEFELLKATFARLNAVQKHIGFGNFNVISFDAMLSVAKASKTIGAFAKEESEYLERLFFFDAKAYGFFGSKVTDKMTETIAQKEIFKVPRTGHYLYQGQAAKVYESVKKDIGDTIVMTSGVRGIPKQFHLFLAKTIECKGDYSEASHSLAPAGYSYHGIGDFDVGKVGFGEKNFTQDFAGTKEFEKLMQLGYIAIRYPRGNPYGVYFEPWHVEVV
jgi:hypothetical protein